jgi:hypothetical protein
MLEVNHSNIRRITLSDSKRERVHQVESIPSVPHVLVLLVKLISTHYSEGLIYVTSKMIYYGHGLGHRVSKVVVGLLSTKRAQGTTSSTPYSRSDFGVGEFPNRCFCKLEYLHIPEFYSRYHIGTRYYEYIPFWDVFNNKGVIAHFPCESGSLKFQSRPAFSISAFRSRPIPSILQFHFKFKSNESC